MLLLYLLVLDFVKAAVLFDQNNQKLSSLEFNPEDKLLCDQNDIYILGQYSKILLKVIGKLHS